MLLFLLSYNLNVVGAVDEDGRPIFQASALLKRKRIFHNNLFDTTVKHHNVSKHNIMHCEHQF